MRCLYCGKELALLKRLTGGGDFCSEAHKQSYQEEYNRLALSRLLQAQKKKQQSSHSPEKAAEPDSATVAVQEEAPRDPEPKAPEVPSLALTVAPAADSPPEAEIVSAEVVEASICKDDTGNSSEGAQIQPDAGPEPTATAGFLLEKPAAADITDQEPYVDSWLDIASGPALSAWKFQSDSARLSPANLLPVEMTPKDSSTLPPASSEELSPEGFALAPPDTKLTSRLEVSPIEMKTAANSMRLPTTASIALDITPVPINLEMDRRRVEPIAFETAPIFDEPGFLALVPAGIELPAEDSIVITPIADAPPPRAEEIEQRSPRESLQALARLHQELAEEQARQTEEAQPAGPVEVVKSVAAQVVEPPEPAPEPKQIAAGPRTIDITADEEEKSPSPKVALELFEIPIKILAVGKPVLIPGEPHPTDTTALLPQLKSLPLRPRMALATGYKPPVSPQAKTSSPPAETKPGASSAPPKKKEDSAKAEVSAKADVPKPAEPAKPKPVEKASSKAASTEAAAKPAPVESKPASASPKIEERKSAPVQAAPKTDEGGSENIPSFNIAQAANVPWWSSLKLKLGIAILLLVIACVYFLGWGGGRSGRAATSNTASNDGSGPSIIMGEGGWVENWGGDPIGMHAGREITIYRPSLKLSDYRLEFQGSIDTKSLGWVFRASDPENYYAMKLMTVSSGRTPKLALFKYLVAGGKQTQVGRVPIDLAAQPDTMFDIRLDVRGPRFTTFIQGQQVDSWTDDQLKAGGVGFLNERDERGKVNSVSIRYLSGGSK